MVLRLVYLAWLRRRLRQFCNDANRAPAFQQAALLRKIERHRDSDFGRDHGFAEIRSVTDFRRHVPVQSYEDHQPYISRVLQGETTALFSPDTRVLMFAMTSGTTGEPKRLPITEELFHEYSAGWRLWGTGTFNDHRELVRLKTVQLSSDWQRYRAPSGVACGQISGLAATTRPRIANRAFLLPAVTAQIHDPVAKHYTALRLALATSKVGMIVTANPSTLVEFARLADRQRDSLVRDIHDGCLSCEVPSHVAAALASKIGRRNPGRARELSRLIERHGALVPKHAWPRLSVLAVWTGGSVGVFLPQLTDLYGRVALRDHGLSASEGRMTIPLADNTSSGVLDFYHHFFEFIPVEEFGSPHATVLEGHELEEGREYFILLTTSGGLYRYNIHDIVRCTGFQGQAPLLEFMSKGKNFSNLAGEKISEHQVIEAVERGFAELGLAIDTFTLAPVMDQTPRYVLLVEQQVHQNRSGELARSVQANLARLNEEYAEKTAGGRLLPVQVRSVPPGTWSAMRREKTGPRGNFEEYKHPCLVSDLEFADRVSQRSADASVYAASAT